MNMKRIIFFFAVLSICGAASAQQIDSVAGAIDTVHLYDTWYMYNPMPLEVSDIHWTSYAPYPSLWDEPFSPDKGDNLAVSYQLEDSLTVLGVAYTGFIKYDEYDSSNTLIYPLEYINSFSLLRFLSSDTVTGNPIVPFYIHRTLEVVPGATGSFQRTFKECAFEYQWTHHPQVHPDTLWYTRDKNPGALAVQCYEFYFDSPICLSSDDLDSFFVGRIGMRIGWPRVKDYRVFYQHGDEHSFRGGTNGINPYDGMFEESRTSDYLNAEVKRWGTLFPIIGFRCTAPQYLQSAYDPNGDKVLRWPRHRDAEVYQMAVDPQQTTVTLAGTLDSILYSSDTMPYIRKGCRFRTSGYDTLVYSPWSKFPQPSSGGNGGENNDSTSAAIRQTEMLQQYTTVQPNPATETAKVISSFGLTRIEAFNTAGDRIYDAPHTGYSATLDVSRWPSGTYIIRLHTPVGTVPKRLVVQ